MAFEPASESGGSILHSLPTAEGDSCYVNLLCDEEDLKQSEELEIHIVNDPTDDWILSANENVLLQDQEDNGGTIVDPNTQELVSAVKPSIIGCKSYISSTELIDSAPSTAIESVESYLTDNSNGDDFDLHRSHSHNKVLSRPQANTVKRIILLDPGEDPEKATAKAISDITDSLNQRAAQRLAEGHSPEKETVIEITRIKAPSDGYFSRENILRSQRERLLNGPSHIKAAAQKAPASVAILQARMGVNANGVHTQISGRNTSTPHQHHRRKSPHSKKQMYSSPAPPSVPKPQPDPSEGCYFSSSARIHRTVSTSSSQTASINKKSSTTAYQELTQMPAQAFCSYSSHKLTADGKLGAGTTTYAAPTSKGPTILRSRSTLRQRLPRLKIPSSETAKPEPSESELWRTYGISQVCLINCGLQCCDSKLVGEFLL